MSGRPRQAAARVVVVGLDCAPPALVFDRFAAVMPTLRRLRGAGTWGPLRSTMPPITIPAWAAMTCGKDPGELGLHGFRTRVPGTRTLRTTTAADHTCESVFDVAARAGKRTAALYVPPSWPPRAVENGVVLSCLLTPGDDARFAEPVALEDEIRTRFGGHRPDVDRAAEGSSPDVLLEALHELVTHHFDVAEHVLRSRDPDLLMLVEMATDRLHHALWPTIDPHDPRHVEGSPHARGARDLYAYLDLRIARLWEAAGESSTMMVVSDHGARPVLGGIHVNEWLRREGWLVLSRQAGRDVPIAEADVDWARTRAWAEGGYHARVWLNDAARFGDEGCIPAARLDAETRALASLLGSIHGPDGAPIENRVVRPVDVYRAVRGEAPDLLVFLGDLDYRALGTIGAHRLFSTAAELEGGTFRGGCNHDWNGIVALAGRRVPALGRIEGASILDIGRTILGQLGVPAPPDWQGRDLCATPPTT